MKQTTSTLARLRHRAAAAWCGLAWGLRLRWKNHLGTLLMVVGVFVAVQAWQTRDVPSGQAPDLRLTLLQPDGSSTNTTLAAWRQAHPGQPVGLYVWAEWCPICKTMEGSVTALSQDQPLLTIAMQSGPPGAVARVLQQRQLPWHQPMLLHHRKRQRFLPGNRLFDCFGDQFSQCAGADPLRQRI